MPFDLPHLLHRGESDRRSRGHDDRSTHPAAMELIMNKLKPIFAQINKMPRAALIVIGLFVLIGTFAPFVAPQGPSAQNLLDAGQGPGLAHFLGTDHLGRDTLTRLILAANTSLVSVGSVLIIAMTIGVLMGTIAGYHRGWVDDLLM